MSDMTIDKGIAMPNRSGIYGYKETIAKMEEGDSVLFTDAKRAKGFARAVRDAGFETAVARTGEGTRVWRGKKKNAS